MRDETNRGFRSKRENKGPPIMGEVRIKEPSLRVKVGPGTREPLIQVRVIVNL